jgi:hypothetical protein
MLSNKHSEVHSPIKMYAVQWDKLYRSAGEMLNVSEKDIQRDIITRRQLISLKF